MATAIEKKRPSINTDESSKRLNHFYLILFLLIGAITAATTNQIKQPATEIQSQRRRHWTSSFQIIQNLSRWTLRSTYMARRWYWLKFLWQLAWVVTENPLERLSISYYSKGMANGSERQRVWVQLVCRPRNLRCKMLHISNSSLALADIHNTYIEFYTHTHKCIEMASLLRSWIIQKS